MLGDASTYKYRDDGAKPAKEGKIYFMLIDKDSSNSNLRRGN